MTIEYEGETYVAYGDDIKSKTAERLSALHMLYILDEKGLVRELFFINPKHIIDIMYYRRPLQKRALPYRPSKKRYPMAA